MTFLFYRDQRQNREHGLIVLLANGCLSRLTTPAIKTASQSCNEVCQYLRTLTYSVLKLEILALTIAVCIALCFSLAQTLPWEKNKKLITCFVPIVRVQRTWWESLLAMAERSTTAEGTENNADNYIYCTAHASNKPVSKQDTYQTQQLQIWL